jgi:formylglycine-generating enzyme required for sulfatase activity
MSRAEITTRQYMTFLMDTGYPRPKDPGFAKNYLTEYPNLPVVNVSYDDAIAFCAWASKKVGATVRLPSEAEWEYAALAGRNGVSFPWGPQDPNSTARFKGNAPLEVKTAASDAFPPNSYGLYNMTGNVWEWVQDYYSKDYYTTSPIRNPKGPVDGMKHSIRGGSWADDGSTLRVTRRAGRNAGDRSDQIGFRVVVSHEKAEFKSAGIQ